MRLGDRINEYEVVTEPTNAGGGMSQWAFARKGGADYFLKMFLAPKYPLDDGPGSREAKARKRATCIAFEQRHLEIGRRLDPSQPGGGNLVVANEFFRVESTYVKVMDKIDPTPLPSGNSLSGRQIVVLLRSLAHSLRLMHQQQVVHSDLKPDNVMVQQAGAELLTAKLIDLDEAYVVGQPPTPEHIVGDPSYYSPEMLRYIKRDERLPDDALGTSSDMFSLGLLLHTLLVGDLPGFDRSRCNYPAEALLSGQPLVIDHAPPVLQPLLARMLALVPSARPTIDDFIGFLTDVDPDALVPTRHVARIARPRPASPAGSTKRPTSTASPVPASTTESTAGATAPPAGGGLRSTMGKRPRPDPAAPPDR